MTLVYFNNCALDAQGRLNPFFRQEYPWLTGRGEDVVAVCRFGACRCRAGDKAPFALRRPGCASLRAFLRAPFQREVWSELRRMARARRLTPVNLLKLLMFAQRGLKMYLWAERMFAGRTETPTLYAYWMSYDAYAAALFKRRHPQARLAVRGHAYDVDVARNPMNPYLMKRLIAQAADAIYPISQAARAQYLSYMAGAVEEAKLRVVLPGSAGEPVDVSPEAPMEKDGVLHIVSCARLIPLKRVELLAGALARWQGMCVHWTHIGGGEGEAALRALAEETLDRKENVVLDLLGDQTPEAVEALYRSRPFDLFVNTSQTEGVPVSIMEAMRFGIPAVAPRIGGIPELIRPETGILFDADAGEEGVLEALERFCALAPAQRRAMRRAAKSLWDERCYLGRLMGVVLEKEADGCAS